MDDNGPSRLQLLDAPPSESSDCEDHGRLSDELREFRVTDAAHWALFENAPYAMLLCNSAGRIARLNVQAELAFGYQREELIGHRVEELIPERFRDSHEQQREGYLKAPKFRPMDSSHQLWALRKDGSEIPVEISLSTVPFDEGTLVYSIIRDVSEKIGAQEALWLAEFEKTLSGLSATFINLPPDCVDGEITKGLEILARALDADRSEIALYEPNSGDFFITYAFAKPGIPVWPKRFVRGVLPWLTERVLAGETVMVGSPEDLPNEAPHEKGMMISMGMNSSLIVPFRVAGQVTGAMGCDSVREHRWDAHTVSRVQDVADIFANALTRKRADEQLHSAFAEIEKLKEQLERENKYLREEIQLEHSHHGVVGNSEAILAVLKKAEQVACTDSTVLVLGETGTGKELIARTIHEMSARHARPMVKTNCAALAPTLIESELFGREKGAYTGALAREIGRFELADQSTIFLDEIGELPPEVQSKLLRVLQEGEFERLGSGKTIKVNVRVIAATSRDLQAMVKEGTFRKDLFYRLNVFPIWVPPLRERPEDIPALVWHILEDIGKRMGRKVEGMQPSTMQQLRRYAWPGNVRELRNVIERNLILNSGPIFKAQLPEFDERPDRSLGRLDKVESEHLRRVLQSTNWRIRGKDGAAEILGLKPTTLESRMKKLHIDRPK